MYLLVCNCAAIRVYLCCTPGGRGVSISTLIVHHTLVAEGEDTLCTRQGGAQAGASPVKVGFCTTEDGHPGQNDGGRVHGKR